MRPRSIQRVPRLDPDVAPIARFEEFVRQNRCGSKYEADKQGQNTNRLGRQRKNEMKVPPESKTDSERDALQ